MRCKVICAARLSLLWVCFGSSAAGLGVACGGSASTGASAEVSSPARTEVASPAPAEVAEPVSEGATVPALADGGCGAPAKMPPERLELSVNSSSTTASGMKVHYVGSSTDHYEDGSFDQLAQMRFSWGEEQASELISVLGMKEEKNADARTFRRALGHCWRLAEHDEARVIVEVLPSELDGRRLPSCEDPTRPSEVLPIFDSYYAVEDGARFQAVIEYDVGGHAWTVQPQPKILRHHGTRMEWSNLAEQGRAGLGLARGRPVQITLRFISSQIWKVPDQRSWRSEHIAEIESACLP